MGGSKRHLKLLAESYCKHGFVVVTPNYRLVDDFILDQKILVRSYAFAVMDMIKATEFVIDKYSSSSNFKIDTSKIVVGGVSAGAVMALHYNYLEMDDIANLGIDIRLTKELDGNWHQPAACLSFAGALLDSTSIDTLDSPSFFIHNKQDEIVPCGIGVSKNSPFKGSVYGACYIMDRLNALGETNSKAIFLDQYDVHTSFMRRQIQGKSVVDLSVKFLIHTLYPSESDASLSK